MFRTEEMCELSLLVRRQDVEEVTRAIAHQGALHQVDTSYLSREEDWESEPWQDRIQQYQALEQRAQLMIGALRLDKFPAPRTAVDVVSELPSIRDKVIEVERDIMPLVNQLREEEARLNEMDATIGRLSPLADLDIDLSRMGRLTFLNAQIGIVPSSNMDRFNASLLHVPHVILTLGKQGAGMLVALFGSAKDKEVLERAAHSAYMSPISMPEGYRGTPSGILAKLHVEINSVREKRAESDKLAEEMAIKWGPTLLALLQRIQNNLRLLRAVDRFGQVREVYLIAGWVPARRVQEVIDAVQRVTSGQVAVDITPAEQSGDVRGIPTTLENKGILRVFQGLVTNYSFPSYGEIDPTPLVAVTFVLMFGMMFGDAGHGLVLVLAALAALKGWIPQLKSLAGVAPVLLAAGLSATFFGFLYGSLFGVEDALPAIWLRPMQDIVSILEASVALGVVLSLVGFGANIVNGLRARDWARVLFDRYGLAGLVFYGAVIGIAIAALTGTAIPPISVLAPLLLLPLGCLMFAEPLGNLVMKRRPLLSEGVGLYLVEAVFEIFESVIGYLSGSLSYIRLGAFAVAHGGLSSLFFILGDLIGGAGTIQYWAVAVLGNIFVIGFEGFLVGIQTLRLEYYEFFTKFFRGGGIPFEPLSLSEKNT